MRVPADSAYLSVLRTVAASLAARLDFTIDEIEDLRIAVDEACALVLPSAPPGSSLEAGFGLEGDALRVVVSVEATGAAAAPRRDTFAWTVLTALAGEVDASVEGTTLSVSLRKRRLHPLAP